MPGMWKQVPRWLLRADGPLAIRPTYLPALLLIGFVWWNQGRRMKRAV